MFFFARRDTAVTMTKSKHSHRPKGKLSRKNPTAAIVAIAMLAASAFPSPLRAEETPRDLLGHDSNGVALRMSELRGQVMLLAFWASWCVPCRLELPEINRIARVYGSEKVTVVAINMGEDLRMTRPFIDEILAEKEERLAMKLTSDPHSRVAGSFGVSSLPTTLLFDARGVLRAEHNGYDREIAERLIGQVAVLLEESKESEPGKRERVPKKPEMGVGDLLQGVESREWTVESDLRAALHKPIPNAIRPRIRLILER